MIQFENGQLTVFQSALYQTTSAVITTKEAVILTDPNWLPHEVAAIKAYIAHILGNRKLYMIYTHSDFDHIIAAGAFLNATTIASKAFAERPDKESVLEEIRQFDAQYYMERDYPIIYPEVDVIIEHDGQSIELGDSRCTFYLAPGHTADGLFTVIEPGGILLAGDYLSDVEFPFIDDFPAYSATVHKAAALLSEHNVQILVPGHGKTAADAAGIQQRLQQAQQYLHDLKNGLDQEAALRRDYPFYEGMKTLHEANRKRAGE